MSDRSECAQAGVGRRRLQGLGLLRVSVQGSGFRVQGLGFRVYPTLLPCWSEVRGTSNYCRNYRVSGVGGFMGFIGFMGLQGLSGFAGCIGFVGRAGFILFF